MAQGTVATTSSQALVRACERIGVDVGAVLASAGITREQVEDPDGRLPADRVAALWQDALRRSGDPDLPLRAAEMVPFGAYRVIDFLAASAPTVGEGLTRLARYFPLINTSVELRLHAEGGQRRIELANPLDPTALPRPYAEYVLAVIVLQTRRVTRVDWRLDEVRFAFPRPTTSAQHERLFGCRVAFDRSASELVVADTVWDSPSAGASPEMLSVLEGHAERLVAALRPDEPTRNAVSRLLADELRSGEPTLERVAQRLAISPRTVQRRLQDEGCSFADVLDETRRVIADCYVRDSDVTLTEVAYLLGFSEPSAFSRWFGVSPSRYRSTRAPV